MITAVLYRDGEDLIGCRAEGHSGWAEAGSDIVCAAVSILTCTCVNALESVCGVIPRITEHNPERGILPSSFRTERRRRTKRRRS